MLIFITLKLTDEISWPWVWVLVPLWGPVVLAGVLYGIGAVLMKIHYRRHPEAKALDEARKAVDNFASTIKPQRKY